MGQASLEATSNVTARCVEVVLCLLAVEEWGLRVRMRDIEERREVVLTRLRTLTSSENVPRVTYASRQTNPAEG